MDWSTVAERIARGEDERTEFMRELDVRSVGRTVGRAVAAFANTDGGLVVLGVADDGELIGLSDDQERVAERLTSFLQTGLSAPVQARVGRERLAGGWVHWIEVPRQRGFEPLRFERCVYVRRGRASVEPTAPELQDLYNAFGYVVTEERAIEAAGLGAIDVQAFRTSLERQGLDVVSEPQPELEDDLRARGVLTDLGGELRATVYGVLAFGREPQSYPQTRSFWVECVAYGGRDRADEVLQVAEAKGRLDEQVSRALGWLKGLGHRERYDGVERVDIPRVPHAAVREALVNAVAHRDYAILGSKVQVEVFSDRVVITSPGRLPNGITVESVIRGGNPRSRNESIAHFLQVMGKMEQRGRGWPVMRRAMLEHNGTLPELEEDRDSRWVRVTLSTRPPL